MQPAFRRTHDEEYPAFIALMMMMMMIADLIWTRLLLTSSVSYVPHVGVSLNFISTWYRINSMARLAIQNKTTSNNMLQRALECTETSSTTTSHLSSALISSHFFRQVAFPKWYDPPLFAIYSATSFQGTFEPPLVGLVELRSDGPVAVDADRTSRLT